MAIFTRKVLVRFPLDDSLVKDIKPSSGIKCDICKEGEWGGAIYLSATYWEFVCGARLCSDCSAILEATMDELAQGPASEDMRTDNWGRAKVVCDITGPAFGPREISALRAMGHLDDGGYWKQKNENS